MRDVKAVGDGRLDTWEAVRMNERSYWDQFLKIRACGGLSAVPESDTGKKCAPEPGEVTREQLVYFVLPCKGAGTGWGTTCRIGSKCSESF